MVCTFGEQLSATPPTVEWSLPPIARIGCCEPPQPLILAKLRFREQTFHVAGIGCCVSPQQNSLIISERYRLPRTTCSQAAFLCPAGVRKHVAAFGREMWEHQNTCSLPKPLETEFAPHPSEVVAAHRIALTVLLGFGGHWLDGSRAAGCVSSRLLRGL